MDSQLRTKLERMLAEEDDVSAAWVYGSFAQGRQRPQSDIDVAIAGKRALSPERRVSLTTALSRLTGREVDLVDLSELHGTLLEEVLTKGVRLFAKDLAIYEGLTRRLVYDEADFMPLYRRMLRARREKFLRG